MRIAFIAGGFPLISETFILNQITGLIDLGHDVAIFARRRVVGGPLHADVDRYNLLERTQWFELPKSRTGRLWRAAGAFWAGLRRNPRVMLRCLNLWRYGTAYQVLNNIMHVGPFLDRQYDVVMCHFGTNGIDFVFLKDALPQLRFVTMFHRGDLLLMDEKGPAVYDRLRRRGDAFLSIGATWHRRKLLEAGFEDTKIVPVPIGVSVQQIEFRIRERVGEDFDILTVARLEREKGLDIGLQAIRDLIGRNPRVRVRYRIIGEGSERAALTALIRMLGIGNSVELLGALPSVDVVKWMHASHVFLLPSRSEGTPTVLLEAQASGMPVVATDVGGVVDIVQHGRAGFVVPAENAAALSRQLQTLLDDAALGRSMAEEGRRFVVERHDIAQICGTLSALFKRLVRGSARCEEPDSTPIRPRLRDPGT